MARIVKSIQIDAPREHVFALAVDPARQPEWTTFIREAIVTSGDGKSAGTIDRSVLKVGPRATATESTWTEYRVGEAFARKSSSGLEREETMTFAAADGGTMVEWSVDYKPPMGPLGKFMDVFMMNRVFQNELEASLEGLKAALEA